MRGPSIEFQDVRLTLGTTRILEDISFSVRSGSVHCIVGANGGGKTSLIRSLLGQMPHNGRILVAWQDNQVTGYVPQALDFDKTLPITVRDFIAMASQRRPVFLGVSRLRKREIDAALEQVGLSGKSGFKLGGLSGGERQRVLFAQALIPEPSLLVLDEPMTGLDLGGKEIIEQAVADFAHRGGTVIWINHDIVQVGEVADAMTYIDCRVLLDGVPGEVLKSGAAMRLFPTLRPVDTPEAGAGARPA